MKKHFAMLGLAGALVIGSICLYDRLTGVWLGDLPCIDIRPDESHSHYVTKTFQADPYINAPQRLQAMGRTAACAKLFRLSASSDVEDQDDPDYEKIDVLCRMLFVKRTNSDFRVPWIGGPEPFPGGTDESDWPLAPIEIVDGVPFALTRGYSLYGTAESAQSYLRYCITNCGWSGYKFTSKTEQEEKAALAKLIASPKWRKPLIPEEMQYLAAQIKNGPPLEWWPTNCDCSTNN
jgi:hypothetical protein